MQLTCPSCDHTVAQAPGTKRTICPNCGNFYDLQAASQPRFNSSRPQSSDTEERLPDVTKNERERNSGGRLGALSSFFHSLNPNKNRSSSRSPGQSPGGASSSHDSGIHSRPTSQNTLPPIPPESRGRLTVDGSSGGGGGAKLRSPTAACSSSSNIVLETVTPAAAGTAGPSPSSRTGARSPATLSPSLRETAPPAAGGGGGAGRRGSSNGGGGQVAAAAAAVSPAAVAGTAATGGGGGGTSARTITSDRKSPAPVQNGRPETSARTKKTLEQLRSDIKAADDAQNWKPVQEYYSTIFDSFVELNSTFKRDPNKEYKTTDDPGLRWDYISGVYDLLVGLPQDIQKVVLKAIINSLLKDKRNDEDQEVQEEGRKEKNQKKKKDKKGKAKNKDGPHTKDDLRAYLILVQNPQFNNIATYVIFAHLIRQMAALQDQDHHYLVHWFKLLDKSRFRQVVNKLHNFISCRLFPPKQQDLPPMAKCTWWIPSATKVLALLNAANNLSQPALISYTDFYNSTLDHLDLMNEYYTWQNPSAHGGFTFCQYPFILSISAKRSILQRDSEQQMIIMARRSLVAKVQRKQLPDIGMLFLNLNVRRAHLVSDSLNEIARKQHDLKKKLKVTFAGEPGLDMGGLTKEWFLLLVRQIFQPEYGMFTYNKKAQVFWFSTSPCENYQEFNLVGVLMGLAVYNSIILDIRFPRCCYKKLLSPAVVPYNNPRATVGVTPLTLSDLDQTMPDLAHGLKELLEYEGDVEDDLCMTFQVSYTEFGQTVTHTLKPDGENIPVTKKNRKEFVQLYVDHILNKSVYRQFQAFYHGFHSVCASNALIMLRPEEVETLVCGCPNLNLADLKKVTTLDGYQATDPTIKAFWDVLIAMPEDLQKRFLLFSTGSDRVPIGGMSEMTFKITRVENTSMLPMSHTCFNQLVLPAYKNKKTLKTKLIIAIQNAEGFGIE